MIGVMIWYAIILQVSITKVIFSFFYLIFIYNTHPKSKHRWWIIHHHLYPVTQILLPCHRLWHNMSSMQFQIIRRVVKIGKALVFTLIQRYSDENRSSRLQLFPSRWCAKSKKFMFCMILTFTNFIHFIWNESTNEYQLINI